MQRTEQGNVFDRLIWKTDDCLLLDDLVFRIMHQNTGDWTGGEHFIFYKIQPLIDQYAHYFRRRCDFQPKNIFELGIYDGGSIVFWHELFKPHKHVAVDLADRIDGSYFQKYLMSRGLSDRIQTVWKTNQADKSKLSHLIKTLFEAPPDLIIDDASHLYEPTLASFEALFPLMAPGGLYIIEDWAWGHWRDFVAPREWAGKKPLTQLVTELTESVGSWTNIISDIAIYQGFIAVERGSRIIDNPSSFRLEEHIYRRPSDQLLAHIPSYQRIVNYLKRKL
ncbi:class I SAM-dependent methyltransferase [Nitrosomonas supralitoralis]|uniref:Methyltransferase domain-containing protein n=1 Tax=Nitrosomonas supralitoralis TaxID=2116706 RepID=A0A2P7NW95_9PROT|nr:class I SAM-dependent methyltransferase [Nitrosomonas supralitoralis]PSJ17747.1 hypothetical protein C7H79_06350 [Nitrosomonas supralitoralis]